TGCRTRPSCVPCSRTGQRSYRTRSSTTPTPGVGRVRRARPWPTPRPCRPSCAPTTSTRPECHVVDEQVASCRLVGLVDVEVQCGPRTHHGVGQRHLLPVTGGVHRRGTGVDERRAVVLPDAQ